MCELSRENKQVIKLFVERLQEKEKTLKAAKTEKEKINNELFSFINSISSDEKIIIDNISIINKSEITTKENINYESLANDLLKAGVIQQSLLNDYKEVSETIRQLRKVTILKGGKKAA